VGKTEREKRSEGWFVLIALEDVQAVREKKKGSLER
jgi:hypothetical protein